MAESLKGQVVPKSPLGAPAHVQHLLSKLSESLELDAPRTAFLALRENLVYLLELFAGASAAAAAGQGPLDPKLQALWKKDASLTDVENLLAGSLEALEPHRANPAIGNLRSVFFVGDTTSKPSPRRHSRLLRIAGAPFRGYVFLSEFADLKPAGRDAFAAEVKRYLPILKEWLTAAAPMFKDMKVLEEGVTPEGHQHLVAELGNLKLDLGEAIRVGECSLCPAATARPQAAPASAAKAASTATKSGVSKTAATAAKTAAAAAKKPDEHGATPVKSPVVKKVLVVKRPDGTIVRKVVQTVSASEVAKARAAEGTAPKPATGGAVPRPDLIAPKDGGDAKKTPVKTVVRKVFTPRPPSGEVARPEAGPTMQMARPLTAADLGAGETTKAAAPEAKTAPPEAKPAPPEAKTAPPEAKPAPPEAKTAAPEAKPAAPETKAAAPETKATAPETKAAVPETKAAAPETKAAVPETKAAEPEAKVVAPEAKAAAPEAKVAAPEAKAAAPETKAAEPETKVAAPEAKVAVPETKAAEPEAKVVAPEAKAAAPEAKVAAPETKAAEPETKAAPPEAKAAPPEAKPAAVPETKAAVPEAKAAVPETKAAAPEAKAAAVPETKPEAEAAAPEAKPAEPDARVAGADAKPAEPDARAAGAEAKPTEPETKAAEPEAKAAAPAAKPAEPEAKPAEPEAKAAPPEAKPAEPEAKAAPPEAKAAEPETKAAAPEAKAAEPAVKAAEPPAPTPGKLAPQPEPSEPVAAPELAGVEPAPSPEPEPVSEMGPEEDELLLGPPEEGDIVLEEEVLVSEEDLLLGAPDEDGEIVGIESEIPAEPGPAPAAVSLSAYSALSLPNGAPEHLKHLVDGLNAALKSNELYRAAGEVQATYDFLIRYFAGVTAMCWQSAERKLPDNAKALMRGWASLGSCRELLAMSLARLKPGDGITTALLSALKGPFAERVQRGPDIAGWCERSLEGDTKAANEALSVYLPEIREFLKKCEEYFEGCEHFSEPPSSEGRLEVVVQFGEAFLELCEPDYVIQIRECPVCLPRLSARAAAPAAPVVEEEAAPELADLLFGGAPEEAPGESLLGAAGKPETLILKLGARGDTAAPKSGIFGGLSKKLKVNVPPPLAAVGVEIPEGIPEHFGHILNRVSYGVGHQDPQETCLSVRDALEYLVRFFGGVAGLAARKLGKETPELKEAWRNEPMSVSRCEQILFLALKALASSDDSLAVLLKGTFPTGTGDAHTKTITLDVENRLKALGKFCSQTQAGWDKVRCIRENSRFLPVLKDWLAASKAFFKGVEIHAEAPADDGRMDLVVEHKEHFLELIAPEYAFLIRRCPVCLPTFLGNDPPVPEEDAVAPPAEAPRPGPIAPEPEGEARPGGVRRLDNALEDLLKGGAPAKAPEVAEATPGEAPRPRPGLVSAADDEEPAMAHDVSYIGSGKDKVDGRLIHGGYINVVNVGGGVLSATVRATHPCVTVKPVRFKGKHCRIEYHIDEADLPTSRKVYVVIRSANEERQIPIWQMLPPTSTLSMSDQALRLFMAIPSLVYMFIFLIVHTQSNRLVAGVMKAALGPDAMNNPQDYLSSVKLTPAAKGSLAGIAQFDGTVFILLSGLVPFAVAWIFSKAPPDQMHRNRKWFIGYLLSPLIWVTLIVVPFFRTVITRPELKAMTFTSSMYLFFLFLNGLMAFYLYISRMNELEQWVQFAFMRKFIGVCVWCVYLLCAMMAVLLL